MSDIEAADPSADSTEPPLRLALSVTELAAALGVSRQTVWRHASEDPGFPKPRRICNVKRWILDEVRTYMAGLPPAGSAR